MTAGVVTVRCHHTGAKCEVSIGIDLAHLVHVVRGQPRHVFALLVIANPSLMETRAVQIYCLYVVGSVFIPRFKAHLCAILHRALRVQRFAFIQGGHRPIATKSERCIRCEVVVIVIACWDAQEVVSWDVTPMPIARIQVWNYIHILPNAVHAIAIESNSDDWRVPIRIRLVVLATGWNMAMVLIGRVEPAIVEEHVIFHTATSFFALITDFVLTTRRCCARRTTRDTRNCANLWSRLSQEVAMGTRVAGAAEASIHRAIDVVQGERVTDGAAQACAIRWTIPFRVVGIWKRVALASGGQRTAPYYRARWRTLVRL